MKFPVPIAGNLLVKPLILMNRTRAQTGRKRRLPCKSTVIREISRKPNRPKWATETPGAESRKRPDAVRLLQKPSSAIARKHAGKSAKTARGKGDGCGWRRRWDSNPRYAFTHAGFQDRCIRPLCHSSGPHFPIARAAILEDADLRGIPPNGACALFLKRARR